MKNTYKIFDRFGNFLGTHKARTGDIAVMVSPMYGLIGAYRAELSN